MTIRFDEIDSTSTYLKAHTEGLPQFAVVTANAQTAGRGQRGNGWESEPGENLLMSMLYSPPAEFPPDRQFGISMAVALAVVDTEEELLAGCAHEPVTVKWPNDIYLGNRKLCGILIEHTISAAPAQKSADSDLAGACPNGAPAGACSVGASIRHTVIGIGLNVNQRDFHSSAPNPVSLIHATGTIIPIDTALKGLTAHLVSRLTVLSGACASTDTDAVADELRAEYRRRLWRGKGMHRWLSLQATSAPVPPVHFASQLPASLADGVEIIEGEIIDILPSGPLRLRLRSGEIRTFAFKEISALL